MHILLKGTCQFLHAAMDRRFACHSGVCFALIKVFQSKTFWKTEPGAGRSSPARGDESVVRLLHTWLSFTDSSLPLHRQEATCQLCWAGRSRTSSSYPPAGGLLLVPGLVLLWNAVVLQSGTYLAMTRKPAATESWAAWMSGQVPFQFS